MNENITKTSSHLISFPTVIIIYQYQLQEIAGQNIAKEVISFGGIF